jgi:hypothetical protein
LIGKNLKRRIVTQPVSIVGAFVASDDLVEALAQHSRPQNARNLRGRIPANPSVNSQEANLLRFPRLSIDSRHKEAQNEASQEEQSGENCGRENCSRVACKESFQGGVQKPDLAN